MRPAEEQAFDTAMLIAEGDLQMHDLFAVTLEPEMPRLDHPGMHRADRHLVDLFALDPEKLLHGRRRKRPGRAPRHPDRSSCGGNAPA